MVGLYQDNNVGANGSGFFYAFARVRNITIASFVTLTVSDGHANATGVSGAWLTAFGRVTCTRLFAGFPTGKGHFDCQRGTTGGGSIGITMGRNMLVNSGCLFGRGFVTRPLNVRHFYIHAISTLSCIRVGLQWSIGHRGEGQ